MATWKEKGEVPDSDDEDEDDSQGLSSEGYGQALLQEPRDAQRMDTGGNSHDEDTETEDYQTRFSADASGVIGPLPLKSNSKQPSLSPRVFKQPPILLDPNELPESQQSGSRTPPHAVDDISQSYVKVSSSLSNLESPPAQIQQLDDAAAMHKREVRNSISTDDLLIQPEIRDWDYGKEREMLSAHDELPSTSRRSLRQRNPIQLHPYALEGEKYRRTLMARGMRPLRLAQIQDDTREIAGDQSSPDSDFEGENESQVLSVEDELPASQSSQLSAAVGFPAAASAEHPSTQSGGEDDEFPDIDQLLDRSNEHFVQAGSKRRKTTYGSRLAPGPSLPRVAPKRSTSSNETKMHDIPPSPPATSSPMPVFHAPFSERRSKHVTSNLTSSRAVSLENDGWETAATDGNLPTPSTNMVKHTIDLTVEDHGDEDPFASDSDSSIASRSSEADQSMQVRRVGKKIRGVLPASWLRLDQQTRQHKSTKASHREHRSLSPIKAVLSRRGVAVPKNMTDENSPIAARSNNGSHFILSDSEEEDTTDLPSFVEDSATNMFPDSVLSQTDIGSVMEDDRVDAMLPSQKRQMKLLPGTTHRRKRTVTTSLFTQRHSEPNFQPKITDHLQKTPSSNSASQKSKRHRIRTSGGAKQTKTLPSQRSRQSSTPKLSILDVVKPYGDSRERLPAFIRIAARNAKSKRGLGRHSPTRKFIKLANRADTQDVQSVLRDWREGTLRPRVEVIDSNELVHVRQPLSDISDNVQNPASVMSTDCDPAIDTAHLPALPRKVFISRSFGQPGLAGSTRFRPLNVGRNTSMNQTKASKSRVPAPRTTKSVARPAQLETSVTEYSTRHPSVAFGSTKKVLDTLYRKAYKGSKTRGDVQLARFFGDQSPPPRADTPVVIDETQGSRISLAKKSGLIKSVRPRKRPPHHVDANAAVFRQPSEPLILDFLQVAPDTQERYGHNGKLLGLGKFGISYTNHFDIFPLQSGIFFDKSTFIGSGRLSKALGITLGRYFDGDRGDFEIQLGGKQLRWGPWNDMVSSEFGMCFDWIIEQLEGSNTKSSDADEAALIKCITSVIDYVQNCLSFPDSGCYGECVLRVIEVLCGFAEQLELLARRSDPGAGKLRVFIELSCRVMVLSFQFLRVAQSYSKGLAMVPQLESLLHKAAELTVILLLSLGLAPIRDLYDDLQYMAYRHAGIQCDRYAAHAWVILMHTVDAAQIPRVSFWDVMNSQIVKDHEAQFNDARVLERMWYDMFSLLPLTDFDMNGTLVPGARLLRSFENWALPQRMAKMIFELYNSKSRQSPSFNDYCRTLFSRCSHLMQTWGWRRHGIIVGTLFDFFATRKLAHLRNEEVYRSPRFLEELDKDPSLAVDPEDRCFHILLKIIAVSIKQMREAGDIRGIRNLVTRVLPNHDRQYPKEKTVRLRDLASLRNHHDLLCTLFWAAPPELRPPINLIRELVNPGSSHQEAYLINLRSWENLTRFVLAFTPTPTAYLPLATWQNESFTQILAQYESTEEAIGEELRRLPSTAKQLISQHTLATTIKENKLSLEMALTRSLRSLKLCMETSHRVEIIKVIVNNLPAIDTITTGLGLFKYRNDENLPIVQAALDIVYCYVTRLLQSGLLLDVSDVHNHILEDDSQEFGSDVFTDVPMEIFEYVGHLNGGIMAGVRELLRTSLHSGYPIQQSFRDRIAETWALIAATLILAKYYPLSDFLGNTGPFNELRMDHQDHATRQCAPRFLGILASVLGDKLSLESTGRDLLCDWLCMLINPVACFSFEHKLLPLFAKHELVISQSILTFQCHKTVIKADLFTLDGIKSGRADLIHDTLKAMAFVLQNESSEKIRYQTIIRSMLRHMKADLGALCPRSPEAIQHQQLVTLVHSSLTTFFHDVSKSDLEDEFFSASSTYPTDDKSFNDSMKFCEKLRNYGLRLGTTRGQNELNHYLLAALKHSAVHGNLQEKSKFVRYAMDYEDRTWEELSHHFLKIVTPSFIHAAFVSEPGWLLAEPLFEAAQEHLMDIADCDRKGALIGVSEIMSSIVLGIALMMEAHYLDHPRAGSKPQLVYVLLMSTRFMALTFDWLPFSMELCKERAEEIASLHKFYYRFACGAKEYFCSPLKWFVNSLPRYHPIAGSDNRELLVSRYESVGCGAHNKREQTRALRELANPFVRNHNDAEEMEMMEDQLTDFHLDKFKSSIWLFNHMRHSEFFCEAHVVFTTLRDLGIPEFSGVILEDYRQNWTEGGRGHEIGIKFGQDTLYAKGLLADKKSLKNIFERLIKCLGDYISSYEKSLL